MALLTRTACQNRRADNPGWLGSLRGLRCAILLAAVAVMFSPATARAQPAGSREYQVKAAFLFHFVHFVEWPEWAFASTNAPIRIAVLGDDPFGPSLDAMVRGETVRSRPLVIVRARSEENLRDCHLIFISRSEEKRAERILSRLSGWPALTVSEMDGFARRGGIINFYLEGSKVRFEINHAAAQESGLKMSSQLLSLGRIVAAEAAGGRE